MTLFQVWIVIVGTLFAGACWLAAVSLSEEAARCADAASRYVDAYERAVDAACSGTPIVGEPDEQSLETGVYHATAKDLKEYFKGRNKLNAEANERPRSWNYDDDEYEFFSEERRL